MARISDRSEAVIALASGHADWFFAKSRMVAARDETASCRLATTVARFQTKITRKPTGFAPFEEMSAREEARLARLEADRARIETQVARMRYHAGCVQSGRLSASAREHPARADFGSGCARRDGESGQRIRLFLLEGRTRSATASAVRFVDESEDSGRVSPWPDSRRRLSPHEPVPLSEFSQ